MSHVLSRLLTALALVMAMLAPTAASAQTGPRPDFQLPFPCGQKWQLESSDPTHAPALDMFREPDRTGTWGVPVLAPADGTVRLSFFHDNAGNTVQIDHGGGWFTTYIHLESRAVSRGDQVEQGEQIGRVGATGPTSNGVPHLHYELAIDADGNGVATWGYAGSERVPAWFDGVQYSGQYRLWRNVESRNCGGRGLGVASWAPGRVDLFVRGSDNHLKHGWYEGGSWSGWEDLGGELRSDPSAVSWGDGRIDVVARGRGNDLLHKFFDRAQGWSGWRRIDANLGSAPDVASWGPGRLDVVGRPYGSNDLVYKSLREDGNWGAWYRLDANLHMSSGPTAVSPSHGVVHVFVRNANNDIAQKTFSGGSWGSWRVRPAYVGSDPDATSWGPGRIDLVARRKDDPDLVHKAQREDGSWSSWNRIPANLASAPTAVSLNEGTIQVFARSASSGDIVYKIYSDGTWTGWRDAAAMP